MGKEPMNQLTEPMDSPTMEPESWVEPMADTKAKNSTLDTLTSLWSEIHMRLLENQDYRTLVALDRAILDITGEKPAANSNIPKQTQPKQKDTSGDNAASFEGLSQADATQVLLNKVLNEPIPIARLVAALNAHGIKVGGSNPNINLSSILSKDGRFRSVRYKDKSCWWIKGRPFPGELDAQ